jgi:hypothetical protein
MKAMPMRGQRTATNKAKANPFGKGESKMMEAKEKMMAKGKSYAAMEKKYEGKKSTSKMK